jgi:ACS family glucarate transporter-like MFS transporter
VPASRVRFTVLVLLFFVTVLNCADRATLSIAGPDAARQLGLSAVAMGYVFSAFGWAYVICQIPGGMLLDRFGSKRVYACSIAAWSFFTLLQAGAGFFHGFAAVAVLFTLLFLMGAAEAPVFPGNSRIVAAWFPARERGAAAAVFNSAQYLATVLFAPFTAWITHAFGWRYVFLTMGALGMAVLPLWRRVIYSPREHPRINAAELAHIEQGGGLVDMDRKTGGGRARWSAMRQLLGNRMLAGIYAGQYCITTLTYFFLTWFPTYLVKARGLSILKAGFAASLPALFGFCGGLLGGLFSDWLLRRGCSLAVARKTPIVIGMLLATSMIVCNYVHAVWVVIAVMSLAFFGKGIGSLGWAVVSDCSPKESAGLSAGLFNMCGNAAGITTPIVIGYVVDKTHSFNGALVFVAANALGAILCYLVVVGEIRRVKFTA